MKLPRLSLVAALLVCGLLPLHAQVPQIINYQGKIAVSGAAFTGTGQFRFALVNGAGTTTYWSNDGTSNAGSQPATAVALPVVNGLYFVPLGDTALTNMTTVPATVFANSDVRLRVWFNDGLNFTQQLTPDQRITSVGYAMVAGTVPDGAITAAKIAPGAIGTTQLGLGVVETENLAGTVVGGAQIRSGAINTSHIADGSIQVVDVVPGLVPKYDRQMAVVTATNPPIGTAWADVPGVSLTTKNLGANGTYRIEYNAVVVWGVGGAGNGYVSTVMNVDGVDVDGTLAFAMIPGTGTVHVPVSKSAVITNLAAGKVVKLKAMATGLSGPFLFRPVLIIDGVPASQVVP